MKNLVRIETCVGNSTLSKLGLLLFKQEYAVLLRKLDLE